MILRRRTVSFVGRMKQLGIGASHVAALPIAVDENVKRFSSERSFASPCGVAPRPASSGRTTRGRLSRGGDRQANRGLLMIVIIRLCYRTTTQNSMAGD